MRMLCGDKSYARRARKRLTAIRLAVETLEHRIVPSTVFEPIGGTGNNVAHPDWGAAGTDLIRIAPSAYANGLSLPAGANRPSARVISNALSDQTNSTTKSQDLDIPNSQHL